MPDILKELLAHQEQLRSMRKSCDEFERKLNERISEYLKETYGIKDGDRISLLDLVAKVKGD